MNISLITIAYNGYGRFIGQFLAFVSNMHIKPTEVIVVLGRNHGLLDKELMYCIYPDVKIIEYKKTPTFGTLRNIGISHASSDWCWFVSVDDKVEADAILTFEDALNSKRNADYICAQWYTIGLGKEKTLHKSPTPFQMAQLKLEGKKSGFVIPHSPFKKWLWEKHHYVETELPNYDFLLHCVLNGAKFVKADKATTTYLRRPDSHSKTRLLEIKKHANKQKRIMQEGIVNHYQKMI